MSYVKNAENASVVLEIIQAIHVNARYLSEIDGATGDGDHGINMNKGFMLAKERIETGMSLAEAFKILGRTLAMDIGGSMGPIYGTLFSEFSRAMQKEEKITMQILLAALENAVEKLMNLAGAKLGDKTLIDAIYPGKEAYKKVADNNGSFNEALRALAEGAEAGKENTKNLTAKIGRAARLGERSRGFLDAGAASCCIILKTMADAMQKRMIDD
ncbi:dihydroxyacetone kinase subunit DhaL [Pectinatus haikarae]|uniref:Dihydroxyacetone kinase-like protein n=1 Tax=Pectinatus haikarae TaxID=349096 RepID=A0ABT9YAS1_9FIRM|nr:dihydroxyacetone kinase subunit DhaL [Pectinatus haikarae]MDQ0204631.1 dihydroxyacetone kinase-like protein [Pectinatus haikarae]